MKFTIVIVVIGILCLSCHTGNEKDRTFTIYSKHVKDSFEIFVDLPERFNKNDAYDVFYYLDANLKSGKKVRQFIQDSIRSKETWNTIYVGIGHIGNYRKLRRRDFTVPEINNTDTTSFSNNFGQIEKFYTFLKAELIPVIKDRYKTKDTNNSIFGHSFGGLFSIYCLFKNDSLFTNFYSLSPSLWINDYSIYSFNNLPNISQTKRNLFLSVGGRENLNRIKAGADKFDEYLKGKRYSYLSYKYKIYDGETHNSQVSMSIEEIFSHL